MFRFDIYAIISMRWDQGILCMCETLLLSIVGHAKEGCWSRWMENLCLKTSMIDWSMFASATPYRLLPHIGVV